MGARIRPTGAANGESRNDLISTEDPPGPVVAWVGSLFECQYQLLQSEEPELSALQRRGRAFPVPEPAHPAAGENRSPRAMPPQTDPVRLIEHSLLWQTSGKGDRDFGIHFFERRKFRLPKDAASLDGQLPYHPYVFRAVCPPSPLTYHGHLIAIDWLVRVRVFLRSGREQSFEQPFVLAQGANLPKVFQ